MVLRLQASERTLDSRSSNSARHNLAVQGRDLRQRGFTVIPEPIMPACVVDEACGQSRALLSSLLTKVEAAGFDPLEQQFEFQEIATRQRNRWDLQKSMPATGEDSSWASLCSTALAVATPIIREAQGAAYSGLEPIMSGAVISRPGARIQRFHCDADMEHLAAAKADPSHRLYNVFIPLVDIEENGDGTEFWGAPQVEVE